MCVKALFLNTPEMLKSSFKLGFQVREYYLQRAATTAFSSEHHQFLSNFGYPCSNISSKIIPNIVGVTLEVTLGVQIGFGTWSRPDPFNGCDSVL